MIDTDACLKLFRQALLKEKEAVMAQECEFDLDLDAIAEAAAALEKQLQNRRDFYREKGGDWEWRAGMFDWLIYTHTPIFTVCKNKEIDQPFNLDGFLVRRSRIAASEIMMDPREGTEELFSRLADLLQGGIPFREFVVSPYARSDSYPEKLLPLLKAQAAKERQEREQRAKQEAERRDAEPPPPQTAEKENGPAVPEPDTDPEQNIHMQAAAAPEKDTEGSTGRIGKWFAGLFGR